MDERITDAFGETITPEDFGKNHYCIDNPDEIVLENIKMAHLENMDTDAYWLGLYMQDGRIFHLNIGGENLKMYFRYEGK